MHVEILFLSFESYTNIETNFTAEVCRGMNKRIKST